jgi:signal transduction histidine kinase
VAIPAVILTSDRLIQENADRFIPWWIYVGILTSMVLFNAILFFFLKDRAYLYYILYIISLGTFVGLAFKAVGHTYFPEAGHWWARLWPAFGHLGCLFGALFGRSFLHTRRTVPRLDRLVLVLAVISGISAPLALFIPARVSQITLSVMALVYSPLMFILPLSVWRRGFQPARFFLAGWGILGVAGVMVPLVNQGWVPNNIFTQHVMLTGSALEMILFALALANRITEAKKESEIARRQALEGEIHRLRNIELRQANEEILRQQDQLIQAEKMASLGQLTAGVAHEIKNPLNFVNNFSLSLVEMMDELLQEARSLPADKQGALVMLASDCRLAAQKIAEHGGRADGIVRSMLEHATVRPGERCMTDLNRLIEDHLGLVDDGTWGQRSGFHVSVEKALDPGLPPVEVIPQELGRVLLNLLNNAFHAVGERHKREPDGYVPTIRISTHGRDGQVEIRIQDNGTGIPAAARERIFEPFFTTKPPGEGVGLGLSLSYGIITKRHAGTLEFESTENKGTTFVMTLPLHPSRARPGTGGGGEGGG